MLYQAKRVGLKGRRFICYKFRTMVCDADKLKMACAPRTSGEARASRLPLTLASPALADFCGGIAWMNCLSYGTCCAAR